jgi:hypothetical protein
MMLLSGLVLDQVTSDDDLRVGLGPEQLRQTDGLSEMLRERRRG